MLGYASVKAVTLAMVGSLVFAQGCGGGVSCLAGNEGVMKEDNLVAVSKAAFDAAGDAAIANDEFAQSALVASGQVYVLSAGARVRFLTDGGIDWHEARVLSDPARPENVGRIAVADCDLYVQPTNEG